VDYWLDLFIGKTWKEFRDSGANIRDFVREGAIRSGPSNKVIFSYVI
jgi:hypothetical protein